MKVFFSWSGKRSGLLAAAFRTWLPHVLHSAEPFFSPETQKGTRWAEELSRHLRDSSLGIIFLTPENLGASWLLFEAGAISKHFDEGKVYTLLFDLAPEDIPFPLAQFQHTELKKQDMLKLILSMHKQLNYPAGEGVMVRLFDLLWPELEQLAEGLRGEREGLTNQGSPARNDPGIYMASLMRDIAMRMSRLEALLENQIHAPESGYGDLLLQKDVEFEARLNRLIGTLTDS